MLKKILIPLIMTTILITIGLIILNPVQRINAAGSTGNPTITIRQQKSDSHTQIYKINYENNDDDPIFAISSHQIKSFDIPFLVEQFGKENVGFSEKDQQLFLNLKHFDRSKDSFQLKKIGDEPLLLTIRNPQHEVLYQSEFADDKSVEENNNQNNPSKTQSSTNFDPQKQNLNESPNPNQPAPETENKTTSEVIDNNDYDTTPQADIPRDADWNIGWKERDRIIVARGIDKKMSDGRTSTPVQYFGALNYALENITVKDSVHGRPLRPGLIWLIPGPGSGTGRKNNLTAANSGIIMSRPGHVWTEKQKASENYKLNYYLNYTFGDGLLYKPGIGNDGGEKVYRGSQRNFITTNLFDYYLPTGDISKPRIYGPDVEETKKVYGLDEKNVHYYIKDHKLFRDGNPQNTNSKNVVKTVMQRLVFRQVMKNSIIQVTVTMQFDNNNGSIITTEFKNIGHTYIDNFQGYTFRDITFIRDHRRDRSKPDNIIRSLGNHKGAYASRNDVYNSRIEFMLNGYPDSPFAWSARGTRSTYYYASDDDHFPWNENGLDEKYDDAFKTIYDRADQNNEPTFGKPFMDYVTDTGISMHTKNQALSPGQQVAMTYSTNIVQKDHAPVLDINQPTTKNRPYEVKPTEDKVKINGTWLYDRMQDVDIKYLVQEINSDSDDKKDIKDQLLKKGVSISDQFQTQSEADMHNRIQHSWSTEIPLKDLGSGLQKISFIAYDKENHTSEIKTYYITIPERGESHDFEINVMTPDPETQRKRPYDPRDDQQHVNKMTITGYSTDLTHNHQIEYQLDDGEKLPIDVNQQFKEKDTLYWGLRDLDLTHLKKDIGIHKITFTLTNKAGQTTTTDFYFQYVMNASTNEPEGTYRVLAPRDIDFGVANMADHSTKTLKPKIKQNIVFDDQRRLEKRAETVKLTLSTERFHRKDNDQETIDTELLWKHQHLKKDIPYLIKNDEQANRIVLNDIFLNNVSLKVDSDSPVNTGSFQSKWTWTVTDSR
ncbi:hypothetical protein [Companilactobacillus furfuricola]|uniref:hypothetical protein n=1 Tax=Companilactobacillus furfuricola TaxID=1462575 RepID=UPI000F78F8A9|nr:hypothetical protein [Companilactobacillus furfuricola]